MAISEAVEAAATRDNTKYTLGSVLNHVLLHQSVIGLEAEKQFELVGDYPDVVIGCVGGGSNFAGISFPFVRHKLAGREPGRPRDRGRVPVRQLRRAHHRRLSP